MRRPFQAPPSSTNQQLDGRPGYFARLADFPTGRCPASARCACGMIRVRSATIFWCKPLPKNDASGLCWSSYSSSKEERTSPRCKRQQPSWFPPPSSVSVQVQQRGGRGPTQTTWQGEYHCGGYIVEIPFTASCADALAVVHAMRDPSCPFVDSFATRFVTVEFFAYHPAIDTHFSAKLYAEQMSGGGWIPAMQLRAFIVFTSQMVGKTIFDFFFLAFVLYYLFAFFRDMVRYYREGRGHSAVLFQCVDPSRGRKRRDLHCRVRLALDLVGYQRRCNEEVPDGHGTVPVSRFNPVGFLYGKVRARFQLYPDLFEGPEILPSERQAGGHHLDL